MYLQCHNRKILILSVSTVIINKLLPFNYVCVPSMSIYISVFVPSDVPLIVSLFLLYFIVVLSVIVPSICSFLVLPIVPYVLTAFPCHVL